MQAIKALSPKPQSPPWKVWLGVGVIVALAPLILWIFYQFVNPKPKFLPYANPNQGITIKYPENWKTQEGGFPGDEITFFSTNENPVNACYLEIKINLNDLNQIISLDKYKNIAMQKIKNSNPNSQLTKESQKSTTSSNFYAYKLIYTRQDGQCKYKVMEIGTVRNGKAYYITYTAEVT